MAIADLKCLNPVGRMYCLLTAYMDESYNNRTMCVGGWLASDKTWGTIQNQWQKRIEHERRMSIRKGEIPISRYHATYCSNLKREYTTWTIPRQILFTKKLITIIGRAKPFGIAVGANLSEFMAAFPEADEQLKWWEAYRMCMAECFYQIGQVMDEHYPQERVTVIHERGPFDSAAQSAFDQMFEAKHFENRKYFVTIAAMGWEDCIPLQPADFIAFEGFRQADEHKRGKFDMRKSLRKVISEKIPLVTGYFTAEGLMDFAKQFREEMAVRGLSLRP